MVFEIRILEIALVFPKGLHHRLWVSDFGQGEAELVEQELVNILVPFRSGAAF